MSLDHANEVYDYKISWNHVNKFIDILEESYPYDSVEGDYSSIPWTSIRESAYEAFNMISEHRTDKNSDYKNEISFRYDWRLLLAVIRAYLPKKEVLGGPTMESVVKSNFQGQISKDPGPDTEIENEKIESFAIPAGEKNMNDEIHYESGPFAESLEECNEMCMETDTCKALTYFGDFVDKFGNWNKACLMYSEALLEDLYPFSNCFSGLKDVDCGNKCLPMVVEQPKSLSNINPNDIVTIAPIVKGQSPMKYEWFFKQFVNENYIKLRDTTPSITITANSQIIGSYYCHITNNFGSITTEPADIFVNGVNDGFKFTSEMKLNEANFNTVSKILASVIGFKSNDVSLMKVKDDNEIYFHVSDITENANEIDSRLEYSIQNDMFKDALEKSNIVGEISLLQHMTLPGYQFSNPPSDNLKIFWSVNNDEISIGAIAFTTDSYSIAFGKDECNCDLIKVEGNEMKAYSQRCESDGKTKKLTEKGNTYFLSKENNKKDFYSYFKMVRKMNIGNKDDFTFVIGSSFPVYYSVSANSHVYTGFKELTSNLRVGNIKVDCVVGDWYLYKECDKECGGGIEVYHREILIYPIGSGENCPVLTKEVACNTQECHPCTINNGGCSEFAYCNLNEDNTINCTCMVGFEGDGITCEEKIYTERIYIVLYNNY